MRKICKIKKRLLRITSFYVNARLCVRVEREKIANARLSNVSNAAFVAFICEIYELSKYVYGSGGTLTTRVKR